MARNWGTALVSWLLEELPERVWEIIIETKLVLRSGETVENTCWCDLVWEWSGQRILKMIVMVRFNGLVGEWSEWLRFRQFFPVAIGSNPLQNQYSIRLSRLFLVLMMVIWF